MALPWISRRDTIDRVLIRRDPGDISRIYLFDQQSKGYLEIPYHDLSSPAIGLWEYRMAMHKLQEQRREEIDEGIAGWLPTRVSCYQSS